MTKIGIIIFFIVFVIMATLFQILILNIPFTLNLMIWSVLSGIISTVIVYLIQKYKRNNMA